MNVTAEKFGYPDNLLCRLDHWLVLLRPAQVTVGSLVLVCTDDASQFGRISGAASAELVEAVARIEGVLGETLRFDKINYLMLMMVDPDVHFHVIPRYANERSIGGASFPDPFWPGPPDVTQALDMDAATLDLLRQSLRAAFSA